MAWSVTGALCMSQTLTDQLQELRSIERHAKRPNFIMIEACRDAGHAAYRS